MLETIKSQYYWVMLKNNKEWTVGCRTEWSSTNSTDIGHSWSVLDTDIVYDDTDFSEIGEEILSPYK